MAARVIDPSLYNSYSGKLGVLRLRIESFNKGGYENKKGVKGSYISLTGIAASGHRQDVVVYGAAVETYGHILKVDESYEMTGGQVVDRVDKYSDSSTRVDIKLDRRVDIKVSASVECV